MALAAQRFDRWLRRSMQTALDPLRRPPPASALAAPSVLGTELFFLLNFAAAKLAIYLVPIGLAATSSPELYGGFEAAYAVGLLAVSAMIGPTLHGLNHRFLLRQEPTVWDQAAALVAATSGLGLLSTILLQAAGAPDAVLLASAIIGATGIQITGGFLLRMFSRRKTLAWFDGAVMFSGVVAILIIGVLGSNGVRGLVGVYMLVSAVACAAASAALVKRRAPALRARLAAAGKVGIPMGAYSMFSTWAAVAGRVIIGSLVPGHLPAFGLAFRIAGVAAGVQQLAATAAWSRLYRARTREADPVLALFLAIAAAVAVAISQVGPSIFGGFQFAALTGEGNALARDLLPVLSLQVFFWIGHTLLQGRIYRYRLAGRCLVPFAVITVAGLLLIVTMAAAGASTLGLTWLVAAYSGAYFLASIVVLHRRGLPHRLFFATGAAGTLLLVLVALVETALV